MIDWESKLQDLCEKIGASHAGAASLNRPTTWSHYEFWLEQGFAGEMEYLKTHAAAKENPSTWKPAMKSALVFGFPYVDHPEPLDSFQSNRIALYAQGADYHFWIKSKLNSAVEELKLLQPGESFEVHTDSSPILERDLAQRAGLGWFGKNTCLIHPQKGSLFLIGEILTSIKLETKAEPLPDFCGKCRACIEICPTQALVSPKVLDANKCISYLTVESKNIPPVNLRNSIGDWFFGCDLCQTICPWNQKVFKNKLVTAPRLQLNASEEIALEKELSWILQSSHHQILKKVKGTPLHRAGAKGLKRNALIVVGNRKIKSLENVVRNLVANEYLGELAVWTLKELEGS